MSNAPSGPEHQRRESNTSEASNSVRPVKSKKKPWSKLKTGLKSLGEKMSAKPKPEEPAESGEQKRARKNKKFKSEEGGEGSRGLMKKLSVESLAAPFVGLQPSTIAPAKSYARAVNSSTSESNLSASDPDTPKKSATPDSGRASQTDAEEAAVGGLVARTEQFAQSLLPPRAAAEQLKGVSAELARAEAAGRPPVRRGKEPEAPAEPKGAGAAPVARRASTKAVDDADGGRKKAGSSVDLIKAETGAGAAEKTAPVRKQRSEEKLGRVDAEGKSGKSDRPKLEVKEDRPKPRENPAKVEDKAAKANGTDALASDGKEGNNKNPIHVENQSQKAKDPKDMKDDSKRNDEFKRPNSDASRTHFKEDQNLTKRENKEPPKDAKKAEDPKENKDVSTTPVKQEAARLIKNVEKGGVLKEGVEKGQTTQKDKKPDDAKRDPADQLMSVGLDSSGASNFIKDTTRDGLTVEEKLDAFLSAEKWPSSLREDVAQTASNNSSQQGGGEKRECLYKILVIGELGTGKTSIIKRYVHQFFSQHYRATIGVDFALKVLNWDHNTIIRLQLWDIAGQERFGNMTRVYYKEAVGAFIVFDVTRSATFDAVLKWKQDLDSKVQLADGGPIPCVLLANKCDQQKEGLVNTPSKMEDYCKENNFSAWFETSAKENINIDDAAKSLVTQILQNDKMSQNGRDSARDGSMFPLESKKDEEGRGSCAC